MAQTPTDPTKAQVWITKGIDDLDFEFYIPRGPKGDPGGIVMGTLLMNADLNTILTSGIYRQGDPAYALTGNNYPKGALAGVLRVYERSANFLWQEYEGLTAGQQSRVWYKRSNSGGVWTPWYAYTSQRVDQTAGRAIYTWDDINSREQRVYGDTGWRDVSADLANGATATVFHIKRLNDQVLLKVSGLKLPTSATTDVIYTPPSGFIGDSQYGLLREQINTGNAFGFQLGSTVLLYGNVGSGANNTTHRFQGMLTAHCSSVWPTTLPGIAVGTIVNT